jgi:pseudouridine synthase
LIQEGRVRVNGEVVRTLPCFATPGKDKITVDGRPVQRLDQRVYVMFNKPARVLVTTKDEPGADRKTLTALVKHPSGARLYPVGRLEYDAMGLVLLTNDGDLTHRLTHPRYGVARRYEAIVSGQATPELLAQLERALAKAEKKVGRQSGTLRAPRVGLHLLGQESGRSRLGIVLKDGTATQVARVLLGGGLSVKKIERISLGPLELTGVARGRWRDLDRHEVRALKASVRVVDDGNSQTPAPRAKAGRIRSEAPDGE